MCKCSKGVCAIVDVSSNPRGVSALFGVWGKDFEKYLLLRTMKMGDLGQEKILVLLCAKRVRFK